VRAEIRNGILYTPNGSAISIVGLLKKAEGRGKPAFLEPPTDQELIYLLRLAVECLQEEKAQ
jgi:hypothetical protein